MHNCLNYTKRRNIKTKQNLRKIKSFNLYCSETDFNCAGQHKKRQYYFSTALLLLSDKFDQKLYCVYSMVLTLHVFGNTLKAASFALT